MKLACCAAAFLPFLLPSIPAGAQQQPDPPPELVVCEDARVRLGQPKQDVRDALSNCCRGVPGLLDDDNSISFESKDGSRKCEFQVAFDGHERLVFAARHFIYDLLDSTTLVDCLLQAVDRILQGQPVHENNGFRNKSAIGTIILGKVSSPKGSLGTLLIGIGAHTLAIQGAPPESLPGDQLHFVHLSDEIGDFGKHVPLRPKNPMPQ